jgi:hypothetical protein
MLTVSKGHDEPCQIIETKFGISHARFVAWNPAVQNNCEFRFPDSPSQMA